MLTIRSVSTANFKSPLEALLSSLTSCLIHIEDLDFVVPVFSILGEVYDFTSLDLTWMGLRNFTPVTGHGAFNAATLFILLP
jgi:hypothetical protein